MLCRFFIIVCWFGVYLLIMPHDTKCIDIGKSLTKLLDNFKDATYLPRDVHFGLNLAYKLLWGIVFSGSALANSSGDRDRNEFYWKTLEYLKVLKSGSHTRNISVNDEIILKSISENTKVWHPTMKHRHLDTQKSKDTFLLYEWNVDKGLPRARDSDKCMSQLGSTKTCVVSSKCLSMMMSREPAYGYHKTHQLLFLLLILFQGCSNYIPFNQSIDVLLAEKCSDIFKEQMILLSFGIPPEYRDLFIEQCESHLGSYIGIQSMNHYKIVEGLFCGIAGYTEFLTTNLLGRIPLWQSNNGCFSIESGMLENQKPECKNHINSLGLALYSSILFYFK